MSKQKRRLPTLLAALLLAVLLPFSALAAGRVVVIVQLEPDAVRPLSAELDELRSEAVAQYSALLDGFAVEVDEAGIADIQSISGVERVYISHERRLVEPMLDSSGGAIGLPLPNETGYTGDGSVIAVLDNEFNVGHGFFAEYTGMSPALDEDDVQAAKKLLGFQDTDELYVSQKIPFAYDYSEGDNDVSDLRFVHGTHVAGIAAGANGEPSSSTTINGVAKDAQLLLMKVFNGESAYDHIIIQAMEDAVSLGADVINLSLGTDYQPYTENSLYTEIAARLREDGVFLSVAGGNAGRGYITGKDNNNNPLSSISPLTPDYGALGMPAAMPDCMAVAACDDGRGMTPFSSWGTTDALLIKPDITAPGKEILSSYDDTYAFMSGTSMAAPQVAGGAAVLFEYVGERFPSMSAQVRLELVENLMMSTAVQSQHSAGLPASVRQQGAGVMNLSRAVASPAILTAAGGRSKIELGEMALTGEFELSFNLELIEGGSIRYNSVDVTVLSDALEGGLVGGVKALPVDSVSGFTPMTEGGQINLTVTLDEDELAAQAEDFPNGFFVEGYVTLSDSQGEYPPLSIPFLGFYGDWDGLNVFDDEDANGNTILDGVYLTLYNYDESSGKYKTNRLGVNMVDDRVRGRRLAAFNPAHLLHENDALKLETTPLRSARAVECGASSQDGDKWSIQFTSQGVLWENSVVDKYSEFSYDIITHDEGRGGEHQKASSYDEESYTITLSGVFAGNTDDNARQTVELPLVMDRTPPEITSLELSGASLSVTAADNHYVQFVTVAGCDYNGVADIAGMTYAAYPLAGGTLEMALPTGNYAYYSVTVADYAGNATGQDIYVQRGFYYAKAEQAAGGGYSLTVTVSAGQEALDSLVCVSAKRGLRMVSLAAKEVELAAGESATVSLTLSQGVEITDTLTFIMVGGESLAPLIDSESGRLSQLLPK